MNHGKPNASMRNGRPKSINERKNSARSKSIGPGRLRQGQMNDMQNIHVERDTLQEYGLSFEHGKLVSTKDGRPFEFNVYRNTEDNQRRYHSIGRLVDDVVYGYMEKEFQLRRISIPVDPKNAEPTSFFFASDDLIKAEFLMIIIHGSGVVKAGQWSRKLIINESLEVGSQLDYILQAQANGYAVIVTNTNLNTDESSRSVLNASRRIRGSGCPEEHACYIWENFVRKSPARHICIMAHSFGGAVVLELASRYSPEFDKRVFAVALTDSPMTAYGKHFSSSVLKILQKRTINWVADTSPVNTELTVRNYGQLRSAGHTLHEWTSYTAFRAIFKFFQEQRQKLRTM